MNVLLLALVLFFPTVAQALGYDGAFSQGGFMIGTLPAGSRITFEGDVQQVGDTGRFIIGFDRHQPAKNILDVTLPDGTHERYEITVTQRDYQVQNVEGVKRKHVHPNNQQVKVSRNDNQLIRAARRTSSPAPHILTRFSAPVHGRITGVYGSKRLFNGAERSWHRGIDIAAPTGTPVRAPAGGIVRLVLPDSFFNGNLIIVDHGYDMMTVYAHLATIDVVQGAAVRRGDLLGTVGSTGRSTGPHLHWGLTWRNIGLDPSLWLKKEITP